MNKRPAAAAACAAAIALFLLSCASEPEPLDLSTLPQGPIPLTSIQFAVQADLDQSLGGERFLGDFFYSNMASIQEGLAAASGISVDASTFMKAFSSGRLTVSREVLPGSPQIVSYVWEAGGAPSPRIRFIVPYMPDKEGRLNVVCVIRLDDKSHKPGYETKLSVKVKP